MVPDARWPHTAISTLAARDVGMRRRPSDEVADVLQRGRQYLFGRARLIGQSCDRGEALEIALLLIEIA